ncbi:monosaccharide ABC transporter membrane protein, CUT2 family [Caminicella sporogenes DSM 14501]|uniref:Monosaccharide ABC transporter membrane protein, CUT2 family n=1 Tax=Caminicella sporogenes DSM 14501 TaxID=1121266 RepID=A0A1M6R3M1_9FIRM|nr:ABC transporter [Caminicella sporogenes]RKD27299.1 ABC transporter [Caminicella sporogenes]WIF94267.1 ABC transporter permease [Caminicella sporogenes]SHK27101.1 monosaccharide ABC transporter membrane protein, CUT2 family [Caminicella sporogenes DSM 14501]
MTDTVKQYTKKIGLPRLIISLFFLFLWIVSFIIKLPISTLVSDTIRRFGMFGILVLAMVPAIQSGIGPNFALPLGIICGLLGGLISLEMGFVGMWAFIAAILISLPFAVITGLIYGMLLNKIKGSEMLVATYTGFSIVSFMCMMWIFLPFKHREMVWPIGKGLRVTISLDTTFGEILNNWLGIRIGHIYIPTGLLLFFFGTCIIVWLFTRSKLGIAIRAAGDNPKFAQASGINVDKTRIIGTILSNVLGAVGILVYAQSYGFFQLYLAPLYMAFPAVAAILIGGASAKKAKISHVIIGVLLFQGLLTVALPVANAVVSEGNLSEVLRMIVQNGIILYALTQVGGEK